MKCSKLIVIIIIIITIIIAQISVHGPTYETGSESRDRS